MSAISEGMPDFISCFVRFQSKYKCFPHAPDLLLSFCAGIVRPPGCQIRGFARLRGRRSCCSHATEIQTRPWGGERNKEKASSYAFIHDDALAMLFHDIQTFGTPTPPAITAGYSNTLKGGKVE